MIARKVNQRGFASILAFGMIVSLGTAPAMYVDSTPSISQHAQLQNNVLHLTVPTATTISTGGYHTCALMTGGGVKCWGNNGSGQLGDGTTTSRLTPVDVSGLASGVTAIAAGWYHTCALTSEGGVKCWGRNGDGQLGDGTATQRLTPVAVSGLSNEVISIAGGGYHTCALTSGGGVKCWGRNGDGQLGDGTTTSSVIPVPVNGLTSGVVAIAAGGGHTCALTSGGGVKCWGDNFWGSLGDGTTTDRLTPVAVSGLTRGVVVIAAGMAHTCALTSGGGAMCWGANWYGQLGDGTTTSSVIPVPVNGLTSGTMAVAAGWWHTCALTNGGGAKCWGYNANGQLGDGTATDRLTPVSVSGLSSSTVAIATGGSHTCALTSGGTIMCWGYNANGQLGDGTTTQRLTPVDVVGLGGKLPIVFVHGWNGAGFPPPLCSYTQADPDSYFEHVDEDLQAAGYYVGYAYLESSSCYTPSLEDNVDNLKAAIDLAKIITGQPKVILIAHSMGGLVSRAYIEGSNYGNDVAALFTFGSPHLGVPSDPLTFLLNGASLGAACENYQPAVCDFSVLGMALFNQDHYPRSNVTYHVISGDAPFFSRSGFGMTMDALIAGPDDGIVPTDSGRAIFLGTFDRYQTDEVHGTVFGSRAYFIRDGGQSTSYTQCIKKVLIDGQANCGTVGLLTPAISNTFDLAEHTPIEYGTLSPGQTITRAITLENAPALFAAQWQRRWRRPKTFTLPAPIFMQTLLVPRWFTCHLSQSSRWSRHSRAQHGLQATGLGPGSLSESLLYRPAPEPGR